MTLSTRACLDAISTHSRALAEAAAGRLDAPVEHCPGWSLADLVWHVSEVHWFWRTIVAELLDAPPEEDRRPARPADAELVESFAEGAEALVETLARADQSAPCWTWAPAQQDVAFVTRHQVQEAAVHHFDAAQAVGAGWEVAADVAADCVEEFLTFSVSSEADPADPPRPSLEGLIRVRPSRDGDDRLWQVFDGPIPGTLAWSEDDRQRGLDTRPGVVLGADTHASGVLLWLYGRRTDEDLFGVLSAEEQALADRFHALCFTS